MKFLYIKERLCSMKVSRERLQIIGKMIGILREEKRQNKQNSWTQIRFCENICSPNTLKSIESGKVGRSDAIYEQLLAKLDLKYGEFPVIDEGIEKVIEDLYEAVEYYDIDLIKKHSLIAKKILEQVKDYIYYSQLYEMFFDICDYYTEFTLISEEKMKLYQKIIEFYNVSMQDIMKVAMFTAIKQICMSDENLYAEYVASMQIEASNYNCLRINLLHYYYKTDQRFKMMNLINELELYFQTTKNSIRLLDVYNYTIIVLSTFDKDLVLETIEKVENLISNEQFPVKKISESYGNIATYFYIHQQYAEAKKYLLNAVKDGCDDILINYILIADCQNKLGEKIDIPDLDNKIKAKFRKELRIMFNYFLMYNGEEVPSAIKQKILMKRIVPLLEDDVAIDVFNFELKKLVKQTNSYKDLSVFDEEIKKNKKS